MGSLKFVNKNFLKIKTRFQDSRVFISTAINRLHPIKIELDKDLEDKLLKEELKPKKHYGVNKVPISKLPDRIMDSMKKVVGDYSIKQLIESGQVLNRYLFARKAPLENETIKEKVKEFAEIIENDPKKFKLPEVPPDPKNEILSKHYMEMKRNRIDQLLRQRVYAWQAVNYNDYQSLLYLFGRAPQEYASLIRIFNEIKRRDPNFKPTSFFDFGSGVGTGVWAVSEFWGSSIYEYYLIDASKSMSDLSDLILRDGSLNKPTMVRNVYQRQFLPSRNIKYNIVLSSYSMFEQPTLINRLEIANNLWNKTQDYLIFVENGSNSGFKLLCEIRDFLIDLKGKTNEDAFIFSPCPHESECPRFTLNDGTPCNFEVRYNTLPFSGTQKILSHLYSYLVIKKGKSEANSDKWPRIVRPTIVRSKHTMCHLCTKEGEIQNIIITESKHGRPTYRCAKHSNWGDQFPINKMEHYEKPNLRLKSFIEKIKNKHNGETENNIDEENKTSQ
ncbi:hypothetical protein PVAND_012301 [Polypedilum vanderplanki]|uniref:Methyltransferase-like protein 17, mitochondrial n=1 Tax=Polypedilum vanderplanki TaxID=319348 RepID=A0A9J6CMY1_POLVA|nr:hypothetical protein PVAND_012301 [Polypedilum vanderplanki]